MYQIVYSPIVQEKLAALKVKLIELCGDKNYFLYYIEGRQVNVMEMYDEREDFARSMFGIITTTQETLDYWDE